MMIEKPFSASFVVRKSAFARLGFCLHIMGGFATNPD